VGVDEHTITLDQAPFFYLTAPAPGTTPRAPGSGTPVLYLHGIPMSGDDWIPFLERTGGIAPDLPGFGRSSKAGNLDYSIDGHAAFIERLLEHLRVDRVMLVAHDWGAAGGLAFAERHRERVERIVLIDVVPLFGGARWPRLARLWRRPLLGELLMGSTTKWLLGRALRSGTVDPGAWSDARIATIWEQFDQGTQRAILRLHRSTTEQQLVQAGERLSRLDVPTLVVWGERDPWFGPQLADVYATHLPHATVDRIENAGHWPWLDRPELIGRITAFLDTD
jgi:pimeloyl-ACP methyl ester carboxylesterase